MILSLEGEKVCGVTQTNYRCNSMIEFLQDRAALILHFQQLSLVKPRGRLHVWRCNFRSKGRAYTRLEGSGSAPMISRDIVYES